MKLRTHKSNGPKAPEKYKRSHERNLAHKEERRRGVEISQAVRESRSTEEQLAILAERPGHSTKEIRRLEALMHRN